MICSLILEISLTLKNTAGIFVQKFYVVKGERSFSRLFLKPESIDTASFYVSSHASSLPDASVFKPNVSK